MFTSFTKRRCHTTRETVATVSAVGIKIERFTQLNARVFPWRATVGEISSRSTSDDNTNWGCRTTGNATRLSSQMPAIRQLDARKYGGHNTARNSPPVDHAEDASTVEVGIAAQKTAGKTTSELAIICYELSGDATVMQPPSGNIRSKSHRSRHRCG